MPSTQPPATGGATDTLTREEVAVQTPWSTLLWNDPVNATDYVTLTLMRVLHVDKDAAERLMLLAHTEGRTTVKSGELGVCTDVATQLGDAGLWATLERAGR